MPLFAHGGARGQVMPDTKQEDADALELAISDAQARGVSRTEIARMVSTIEPKPTRTPNPVPAHATEQIYDELPDGLIDLPTAAKRYGIPVKTLGMWVHRGKLPRRGRLKAKAAGGGYIVTEESAILHCRDNPRKRGPKSFVRP